MFFFMLESAVNKKSGELSCLNIGVRCIDPLEQRGYILDNELELIQLPSQFKYGKAIL